ncbi:hypothetical protein [Streptomyces hirsutus]|uniref:hypothetical protein n=1 Tax=Streptomyces hirsutus TaxID=35620 RepID=UPI00367D3E62
MADNIATETRAGEPIPSSPRCDTCNHPKRDHDGHADHRARFSQLVAGDPWCHACNVGCDYVAVSKQEATMTTEPQPLEQEGACECTTGSPGMYEGPPQHCPAHGTEPADEK